MCVLHQNDLCRELDVGFDVPCILIPEEAVSLRRLQILKAQANMSNN